MKCLKYKKFAVCPGQLVKCGVMRYLSSVVLLLVFSATCTSAEPPCVSASGVANLSLTTVSPEAVSYIKKYSLPGNPTDFCNYLERLERQHQAAVEEGLIDMVGDYFFTTQSIETDYFFSYKLGSPGKPIPQIILDRAANEDQMLDRFLMAVDKDPDAKRKALLESLAQKISGGGNVPRRERFRQFTKVIFEKSWIFKSEFQQAAKQVNRDDNYNFVGRGLRTTTPIFVAALVDHFISSATGKQILPGRINRMLIIGPGLQFSDPDLGEEIPQESHEPFTLMDSLFRNGMATPGALQVDLLDINSQVVRHFKEAAASNKAYDLHIVINKEENLGRERLGSLHYGENVLGTSLPGVQSSKPVEGQSRRPSRGSLDPAQIVSRSLTISAAIVKMLHAFEGDMTSTDLRKLQSDADTKYDAIFCFNTLIYLDEKERMLAGVNIREALAQNGVFVTDNRFVKDIGERPGRKQDGSAAAAPIFDSAFLKMVADYNEDDTNMGPVENPGRRTIVYRRGD